MTLPEAWCWVGYPFQPTCSGSLKFRHLCVTFKIHHDLALYYIFSLNFHHSCACTQGANQTENSWSFLQCSPFFPPLFLFPFSEEDVPSTLQMKLLHTLRSNSHVTYCKSFPDFSHSQQEIIVFSEFWSWLFLSFFILYDYFYILPYQLVCSPSFQYFPLILFKQLFKCLVFGCFSCLDFFSGLWS